MKAIPLLRVNFGRVYVEIAEPIFMKKYLKDYEMLKLNTEKDNIKIDSISTKLGYDIIYKLN